MDIKGFDISDFVRHVLTGFNFILFVLILPLLYTQPSFLIGLISETSFLLILFLSIAIGYLFDILKIYKLAPHYRKTSNSFWNNIANTLNIPQRECIAYFYLASNLSKKYGPYDLTQSRSRRVLMQNTSVILLISLLVWMYIVIQEVIRTSISWRLTTPLFIIALLTIGVILLVRNAYVALQECNQEMLVLLEHNKKYLLQNGWKINLRSDDKSKS